jgi:hypothetical protein
MFVSSRNQVLGALCGVSLALTGAQASAQHWHLRDHYRYRDFHGYDDHYDYHRGSYHPGTRYVGPGLYDDHPYDHQHFAEPSVEYRFGGFSHIDDLAASLESQANLLCWELYYNYQHNPGYRATYREVYEMAQMAKFIHGLEHARNRDRIKEEVVRMDDLFHHIHRDVATWTGHHHRQVGGGGLTSKLERMEDTLHHLMDDVGVRSQSPSPVAPPASDFQPVDRE